jgi:hypothetical protein
MKPHSFAIRYASQLADIIDGAGVRRSKDAYDAHGAGAIPPILLNGRFECVDPYLKIRARRQRTQRISSQTDAIHGFIDRYMPLF